MVSDNKIVNFSEGIFGESFVLASVRVVFWLIGKFSVVNKQKLKTGRKSVKIKSKKYI